MLDNIDLRRCEEIFKKNDLNKERQVVKVDVTK